MHHIFDVEIAKLYGVNAAILLQNLHFWIEHNRANERCFYEGRYWTYNSIKAFEELFPYLTAYQISGALKKLIDDGIIVKGNFNSTGMDRTLWYSITEKGERILTGKPEEQAEQPQPEAEEPQADFNPFGDWPENAAMKETVEVYAANNLYTLSPGNMREICEYKKKLPEELIRHAIDEACGNGARSWNYVRRILDRYIENRFRTIGQVLAYEEKRKGATKGQGETQAKSWQEMDDQERAKALTSGPFGKFY